MKNRLKVELLKGYEAEIDTFLDVLKALNGLGRISIGRATSTRLQRKVSTLKDRVDELYGKLSQT